MDILKKYKGILLLLVLASCVHAQDTTYFKINWHEETRGSYQIIEYEDRFFVSHPGICDLTRECSSVTEMDIDGNILWEKEMRWLDIAPGSMVIHEDTITISGNRYDLSGLYLYQMSIEGDSIRTYILEDSTYTRVFQLANIRHNGRYLIGGSGKKNGEYYALIWVVNLDGSLDTLISPVHTDERAVIWDMYIDSEGLLTAFIKLDRDDSKNYRMIVKYDDNFNIVWSYTTEILIIDGFSSPRGCELQDGRTVFVYDIDDHINSSMNSIRAINPDSTVSWWYQWPDFTGANAASIARLKTLSNGDIIGVGQYTTYSYDPWVTNAPFIFRISPEGEMLWQRIFVEQDPYYPERTVYGLFYDVHEFENGMLWAVGGWRGHVGDLREDPIVVLMDAEGCITSGCGELIPTPTREVRAAIEGRVNIFPNPVYGTMLTVDIQPAAGGFDEYTLKIYDFQGRLLGQSNVQTGINQVDFTTYDQGIYLFVIEQNGVLLGSEKVLRF